MAKRKSSKTRYRLLVFVPACLVFILVMVVSIGNYWIKIGNKYKEKAELEKQIVVLKEKEEELKVDVERLEDPDYVARFAREKYMYSKDGEIILRLPEE